MAEGDITISYTTPDGEERDERWASIDAFRSWAIGDKVRANYTAYEEDEDGDLIVVGKGSV